MEGQKRQLESCIAKLARQPRWKGRVDAFCCLKGIGALTALALAVEAQVFTRFKSAKAYVSWLGLVPSERSSGERVVRGGITKCGNSLCRRLLVEASWRYARASDERRPAPAAGVPPEHREPCGEGGRAARRPAPEAAAEGQEARCGEHRDRPRALLLRVGHRAHGRGEPRLESGFIRSAPRIDWPLGGSQTPLWGSRHPPATPGERLSRKREEGLPSRGNELCGNAGTYIGAPRAAARSRRPRARGSTNIRLRNGRRSDTQGEQGVSG